MMTGIPIVAMALRDTDDVLVRASVAGVIVGACPWSVDVDSVPIAIVEPVVLRLLRTVL